MRKYSRMDQVKFFKGCLPQILLGPILNTLPQIFSAVALKSLYTIDCKIHSLNADISVDITILMLNFIRRNHRIIR